MTTSPRTPTMTGGLQRRLLVMLLTPLILLALLNAWLDYRSADNVALQQDQRLLALVPLLADSVIAEEARLGEGPVLLLAPPVEEFLKDRPGFAAFASKVTVMAEPMEKSVGVLCGDRLLLVLVMTDSVILTSFVS